ncbi:MAG: flagellar basal body protein FliL [Alphaproteobacteria bacterium CG_4_9_14_3_um_filter_47_13]|nr:MAG: flagellar basal body protein FliL [Alphaproteobacteria bacterium CG_4_9_14_3_um_filter_47_13]
MEKIEPTLDGDEGEGGDENVVAAEGGGGLDAKKIILFIVLPFFILAGAGGGLYFSGTLEKMLGSKDKGHEAEDSHGKKKGGHGEENVSIDAFFLEIPDMIVNLNADGGETRYLRLSVQLELGSQVDLLAVEAVMPRVVDQFQTYLRELRVRDLRGSQGIYRLQMELLSRVNAAAYPVEVKDVLFQNILIQ